MRQDTDFGARAIGRSVYTMALISACVIAAGRPVSGSGFNGQLATVGLSRGNGIMLVGQFNFAIEDMAADSGADIPLKTTLPSASELAKANAAEGSFLLIRNVPEGVSLSAGMASGKVWLVSFRDVGGLHLKSAPDTIGRFRLEFSLIGRGNQILAKRNAALVLTAQKPVAAVDTPQTKHSDDFRKAQEIEAADEQAMPAMMVPPLPAEEDFILLRRGEDLFRQGSIPAARVIFEDLAARGSARAAYALARTHDPAATPASPASAIMPNAQEALKWYQRAAAFGSVEAKKRLLALAPSR